jgi:hypothetical protein
MLTFSGLEAQADMSRLLDELYGEPDQSFLNQAARRAEISQRHERVESCTSLAISDRVSQTSRHECSISTHEIREASVSTRQLRVLTGSGLSW